MYKSTLLCRYHSDSAKAFWIHVERRHCGNAMFLALLSKTEWVSNDRLMQPAGA